ncbi:MAG TPA: hypothetical protein VEC12_11590 [Bacteroidia bacterium]|nr:hypothetical protein [Bacteroidia bacterium]
MNGKTVLAIIVVILAVARLGYRVFKHNKHDRQQRQITEAPRVIISDFSDTSEKILSFTGWILNEDGKWTSKPNHIVPQTDGETNERGTLLRWLQTGTFYEGNNKYTALLYETDISGKQRNAGLYHTNYIVLSQLQYDNIKSVVESPGNDSIEIFSTRSGGFMNTANEKVQKVTHQRLLQSISANFTTERSPGNNSYTPYTGKPRDVIFCVKKEKKKGKEIIKFNLPGRDIYGSYFEVSKQEFKKLFN